MNNETIIKLPKQVENLTSQLESIAKVITPSMDIDTIQSILNSKGKIKFSKGEYLISKNINISDNTFVYSDNDAILKFTNLDVAVTIQGQNITVQGLKIDCNKKAFTGLLINKMCKNIVVVNNEICNTYETTRPSYGIYISALNNNNIVIKNNYIHDIVSSGDGVVATRLGGWCKGICIDMYDSILIGELPNNITYDMITKNVNIDNNTVENIGVDNEDSDGIYVEGYRVLWNINVRVVRNTLRNCCKRGIKILPSRGVLIQGNTIINTLNISQHSFISNYGGDNEISLNICEKYNAITLYGIECSYDSSKYGDYLIDKIKISNNSLHLSDVSNDEEINKIGIILNSSISKYNIVEINNNTLINANIGFLAIPNGKINTLNIHNNTSNNTKLKGFYLTINCDLCNIYNNTILGASMTHGLIQNRKTESDMLDTFNFENNIISTASIGIELNVVNKIIIRNNKLSCTTKKISKYMIGKEIVESNYDLYNNTMWVDNFSLVNTSNASITLDLNRSFSQYFKLNTAVDTLVTIPLNVNEGVEITIFSSLNNNNITIQNDNNVHLKGNVSAILNNEKSLTLVKLDNRWVEKCRNF